MAISVYCTGGQAKELALLLDSRDWWHGYRGHDDPRSNRDHLCDFMEWVEESGDFYVILLPEVKGFLGTFDDDYYESDRMEFDELKQWLAPPMMGSPQEVEAW